MEPITEKSPDFVPRLALVAEGMIALTVAAGFAMRSPLVTWLWPCQDDPVSAILLAAILASYGGGSIFVASADDWQTATSGGALALLVAFGGFALTVVASALMVHDTALLPHATIFGISAAASAYTLCFASRGSKRPSAQGATPALRVLILALAFAVLLFGYELLVDGTSALPWDVSRPTALLLGWLCVGSACDYIVASVSGNKSACETILFGILVYDLVLLFPLFRSVLIGGPSEFMTWLEPIAITLATALVAIHFLRRGHWFSHPAVGLTGCTLIGAFGSISRRCRFSGAGWTSR